MHNVYLYTTILEQGKLTKKYINKILFFLTLDEISYSYFKL